MLKASFIGGILLGLAAVLVGAGFYPLFDHPRLASRTQVLPNGGRREDFLVRLPVDRVVSLGSPRAPLDAGAIPGSLELPPALAAEPLRADHFKVRDADGNVVGVASRHAVGPGEDAEIAWSITLPSRGALWLVGRAQADVLAAALAGAGTGPGEAWSGDIDIVVVGPAEIAPGRVEGGSDEFAGLAGRYTERWHITGISETGELRGTIELSTTTNLMQ